MTEPMSSPTQLDFTIAYGIEDIDLLIDLYGYLAESNEEAIDATRSELADAIDYRITSVQAECLFTGLVLNGVAEQESSASTFAEYTFRLHTGESARVLREQAIARAAIDGLTPGTQRQQRLEVRLAATFPPHLGPPADSHIVSIETELRQLLFDAKNVVRIANPYFDSKSTVVQDMASLAARGVECRILTREADSDAGAGQTLNDIHSSIPAGSRHLFRVRDLFERDPETGRQAYATHAKMAIADTDFCYIGSANLTETNLSSNFEMGMLLRGSAMTDAITVFDHVFAGSRPIDLPV